MAAIQAPKQPLVAIMGTTGSGKSDLAVDLAVKFNGEIINADAMQMYRGLPVITNQISTADQRGIPHHLLAHIDPLGAPWAVSVFAREAKRLVQEIRSRGKLPIVVGGTHYYIHSLLFERSVIDTGTAELDAGPRISREETISQFPILGASTEEIFSMLRDVDPASADRWHPDERRKILRSLEIYLTTGKRASDIYAEQREQVARRAASQVMGPWESIILWVYTEPDVLRERLDRRVDKMAGSGLMDEAKGLHDLRQQQAEQGKPIDRSFGIWQSIGYKQMEPFLEAEIRGDSLETCQALKKNGLDLIKIATRQYARDQLKWIRNKSLDALKEVGAMESLYLLDSTDTSRFSPDVLQKASGLCERFLQGTEMPQPAEVSDTASRLLSSFEQRNASRSKISKCQTCDLCNRHFTNEDQLAQHLRGKGHRRLARGKTKTALVPVRNEPPEGSNHDVFQNKIHASLVPEDGW
ncbi:IPP transferase-domain-containing protein [Xylariaceae sp. FL0804]|nr:IPP transferase-domain-containing protein [Xylariaceae sp. FL0804]